MKKVLLAALIALALAPCVNATPTESCGGAQSCGAVETASISGVILSGNVRWAVSAFDVSHIGDTGRMNFDSSSPQGAAGSAVTATYTISDLVGCTQGTARQTSINPGAFSLESYTSQFTLTDTTCSGTIRTQLSAGIVPSTFFDLYAGFVIKATADIDAKTRLCAFSSFDTACTQATLDAQVRLCDHSALLAACNQATIDNLVRLCDHSALGAACSQATIDSLVRLCDHSALGSSCAQATLELLNHFCAAGSLGSGCAIPEVKICTTVNVCQVAQSGTWTITDDPTGWAIHQDPLSGTVNVAQSGTWTLTDDANGWSIHQDPLSGTVNTVLSGTTTVVSCTNTNPCHIINSGMSNTTFTGNISIPSNVHVDATASVSGTWSELARYLPLIVAIVLTAFGEIRQDTNPIRGKLYKAAAGLFWLFAILTVPIGTWGQVLFALIGVYQIVYFIWSKHVMTDGREF